MGEDELERDEPAVLSAREAMALIGHEPAESEAAGESEEPSPDVAAIEKPSPDTTVPVTRIRTLGRMVSAT